MNPTAIDLRSLVLVAGLLILAPLAAQTGNSGVGATSGGSPLLNDDRAGEPGTIPAAPPTPAAVEEPSRHMPLGFVGPSGGSGNLPDYNANPSAYRGLWEIHPNNGVSIPEAAATVPMEQP